MADARLSPGPFPRFSPAYDGKSVRVHSLPGESTARRDRVQVFNLVRNLRP